MMESRDDKTRQAWARLAGLLYLVTNATAIFAFWVRSELVVRGDPVRTAANIAADQSFFRLGIAGELVTVAGVIALIAALYTILRPINRDLALLAAFWRLMENCVLATITFTSFAILALLGGVGTAAPDPQLAALVQAALRVHNAGFQVGFLFLGLGSVLFSWLWWKSLYIPRWLSGLGLFASAIMALVSILYVLMPSILGIITLAYMAPMGIFEIGLGLWLLVKGIRIPAEG